MDNEGGRLDCSTDNEHQAKRRPSASGGQAKATAAQLKPRKVLSKAERERRRTVRLAKQFPNGPEAKELASMEKPMPGSLQEKIRRSGKYELWSEAFGWLAADLHRKARSGTQFYPRLVVKKLRVAYPGLDLLEDEASWFEGWIGYLGQFRTKLRSGGTYGPGVDLLVALGVELDVFDHIDSFDNISSDDENGAGSYSELVQPSIDDLPPSPRELPFRFTEFRSSNAKSFWRNYWQSNDIEAIREAGIVLASDPLARGEMETLGEEAETFFVQTMAKLGIPLP